MIYPWMRETPTFSFGETEPKGKLSRQRKLELVETAKRIVALLEADKVQPDSSEGCFVRSMTEQLFNS